MVDSIDLMAEANDEGFQNRVKYAMQQAAGQVMAEIDGTHTASGHDKRAAYSGTVLAGTASVYDMTVSVLTNSTIATNGGRESPDSDIKFAVDSFWDAYSGVRPAEVIA